MSPTKMYTWLVTSFYVALRIRRVAKIFDWRVLGMFRFRFAIPKVNYSEVPLFIPNICYPNPNVSPNSNPNPLPWPQH